MEVSYINKKLDFPDSENEKKRIIELLKDSQQVHGAFNTDLDLTEADLYLKFFIKELTDFDVQFIKFGYRCEMPYIKDIKQYLFIAEKY